MKDTDRQYEKSEVRRNGKKTNLNGSARTFIHTNTFKYIYIYMCVCVCEIDTCQCACRNSCINISITDIYIAGKMDFVFVYAYSAGNALIQKAVSVNRRNWQLNGRQRSAFIYHLSCKSVAGVRS